MIYTVMGVSGAGKTLIGQKLAQKLNIPFYDADAFHPAANVQKMENGEALNDEDREPWLQKILDEMAYWEQKSGAVLACSALKQNYRDILSSSRVPACFIFLKGSKSLITQRMKNRKNHFMPASLLDSQFKALEEPEEAIVVDIDQNPDQIIQDILKKIDH